MPVAHAAAAISRLNSMARFGNPCALVDAPRSGHSSPPIIWRTPLWPITPPSGRRPPLDAYKGSASSANRTTLLNYIKLVGISGRILKEHDFAAPSPPSDALRFRPGPQRPFSSLQPLRNGSAASGSCMWQRKTNTSAYGCLYVSHDVRGRPSNAGCRLVITEIYNIVPHLTNVCFGKHRRTA